MKKIVKNLVIGTGFFLAAGYVFKLVRTSRSERQLLKETEEKIDAVEEELHEEKKKVKKLEEDRKYHKIAEFELKDTSVEEED